MIYKSKNEKDTYLLAAKLASLLKGGDIILLNGDLGAGKTTFVKGIAASLGVKEVVTSPTFTLLKTYHTPHFEIVHIDAYRLENSSFDEMNDYLNDENVLFIEWSNYLENQDDIKENLTIDIQYVSKNQRTFKITSHGKRYEEILQELNKNV